MAKLTKIQLAKETWDHETMRPIEVAGDESYIDLGAVIAMLPRPSGGVELWFGGENAVLVALEDMESLRARRDEEAL